MRVASLDFGTNTFLCLICEVENGEIREVIEDLTEIVRLGEGVHTTRRFCSAALVRAEQAMAFFRQHMDRHCVQVISAVATSAARDVENKDELFALAKKYNIPLAIISGSREAELTFHGALVGCLWPSEDVVVVDVGGGSSEIISESSDGTIVGQSFDVGCVRLTELFFPCFPIQAQQLIQCKQFIGKVLDRIPDFFAAHRGKVALAVAGTPTTLAALDLGTDFVAEQVEGQALPVESLLNWTQRFSDMTLDEIRKLPGMHAKRADVILAGTLLLSIMAEHLNIVEYVVSTRGVRYGLAKRIGSA